MEKEERGRIWKMKNNNKKWSKIHSNPLGIFFVIFYQIKVKLDSLLPLLVLSPQAIVGWRCHGRIIYLE